MQTMIVQLKRSPLVGGLLAVLLILAVAASSIGVSMWQAARRQSQSVSEGYRTIAVPRELSMKEREENMLLVLDLPIAMQAAQDSEYVQAVDLRVPLAAQVAGSRALSAGLGKVSSFDYPCYNMAVLAIQVTDVRDQLLIGHVGNEVAGYDVTASLVDRVSLGEAYSIEPGDSFQFLVSLCLPDGSPPFEVGKTYLLYGYFMGRSSTYPYPEDQMDEMNPITFQLEDGWRIFSGGASFSDFNTYVDETLQITRAVREDGQEYRYRLPDAAPLWAEYTGSWEDYLASEAGTVWQEELIPLCELNQSSAMVFLTDDVQSMYAFHAGYNSLLEGRFITGEEYADGSAVCMVSAAYAEYNGWQVGDHIVLDYYHPNLKSTFSVTDAYNTGSAPEILERAPCMPENRMDVTLEYEIVGIYTGAEFESGVHLFRADTIFVPKGSVPDAEQYEALEFPITQSLVLKNGTQADFEAYMEEVGYGDVYLCFDQSYAAASVSLEAMESSALRLLAIGLASLVLAVLLEKLLLMRKFAPTARSMRLLGVKRKTVFRQLLAANLVLDAISVVLGTALAAALYGWATQKLLSQSLQLQPAVPAVLAAAIFLLMGLLSALWSRSVSQRPMMRAEKE